MFFLLRAAFWLMIVLALLPSGGSQPTADGPKITEAVSAAGAAIADLRHFCTREPEACEVGSQTAAMIGQRAQAGAKMLYEMLSEHNERGATGSVSTGKAAAPQNTLAASDQAPASRGERR